MGVSTRRGTVQVVGSGQDDFQATATKAMISPFAQWLPEMDLAFNVNDEPRILIPHEDADRMMASAELAVRSIRALGNNFTSPNDLNDGQSYDQVSETRFNRLDHQQTWTHSRMSCPPDTPARSLDPDIEDAETGFTFGGISFVNNVTSFSDICLHPSVRQPIGLFNHPNVYSVSHDLIPVFSPSKLSIFHDILYPSPYYYADRTQYDETSAVNWTDKRPCLYWRGATSGGYSQGGTWRTLLRQSILSKLMSPGRVRILTRSSDKSAWDVKTIPGFDVSHRYDTHFTEIKQCSPASCAAMRQHFGDHPHVPQEESWRNRYLLDMDGNALSGRFYALLKSWSLPMKVAYYREWHSPRIFPWKHYVPLSASTDEYAEVLRYFEEEENGKQIARTMAEQGREWAQKTVRQIDMQVYMFRLLLE
ncbi:Beta-1,2-xylosyltransferase 1 [Cyphellophora attinorum]|uniref:Beta-1,2-xylosyltransferase 1 n=1 Tax=Cyphellophora attinorum TaxID=1664694 RepID=A0A0N1H2G7_9EURO|nr:Beta-1,2-xylosyltransferase 1 [Phialophora attinorum]KPI35410.1 Beta-1,2-xylosyltransferase 1 [Phialophora attinorum]